jgi:uncharacterized protein (TIGR00369 family)
MSEQSSSKSVSLDRMQAMMNASPFIRFFGMMVKSIDLETAMVVLEIKMRPELERVPGTGQWHGGAIAALIDTAGDFAIVLRTNAPVPTLNFRVDYLRPATTATLLAIARVRRAGRTVGVVDIDVEDAEGRLVAVGRGCYGTQPG